MLIKLIKKLFPRFLSNRRWFKKLFPKFVKTLDDELDYIVEDEILKRVTTLIEERPIVKLANYDPTDRTFRISLAGQMFNDGTPFKDRYPLNFYKVDEWSKLLDLNGGKVYGKLMFKGSTWSKGWIDWMNRRLEQ